MESKFSITGLESSSLTLTEQEKTARENDPLASDCPKWSSRLKCLQAYSCLVMNFSTVLRFCFALGEFGSVVLIPYIIFRLFYGSAIVLTEIMLGRYVMGNVSKTWTMCPFASVLICMILITFAAIVFNYVQLIYLLRYISSIFRTTLPWSTCDPAWAKTNCYALGNNVTAQSLCLINYSEDYCNNLEWQNSAKQYWENVMNETNNVQLLFLSLIFVTIAIGLVFIINYKGIRSLEKALPLMIYLPLLLSSILALATFLTPGTPVGFLNIWFFNYTFLLNPKEDICSVPGALAFLVKLLIFESTSKTLVVVENAGGILRNISSLIAVREDFRQILRDHNCFDILLKHLRSPSLTVVSNACGTLWNLSARCIEDQKKLLEMGAINMLRNLVQSKHKMISMGSSATLKNLLQASSKGTVLTHLDSTAKILGFQNLPTLNVRKQRALKQEIHTNLEVKCDNLECNEFITPCKYCITNKEVNKILVTSGCNSTETVRFSKSDSPCLTIKQMLKQENFQEEFKKNLFQKSVCEKQSPKDLSSNVRLKTSRIPSIVCKKDSNKKQKSKTKEIFIEKKIKEELNVSDWNFNNDIRMIVENKSEVSSIESMANIYSGQKKFSDMVTKSSGNVKKCDLLSIIKQTDRDTTTDTEASLKNRTLSPGNAKTIDGDCKQFDNIKEVTGQITNETGLNKLMSKNNGLINYYNNDDKLNIKFMNDNLAEDVQKLSDSKPDFKNCSEAKNPKNFENEASKVCQEIKKLQEIEMEMEMGCSVNSEMSIVSSSSFLDASDGKTFDFAYEITQLDRSEIDFNDEAFSLNKNSKFSIDKGFGSSESLTVDEIEDLELENSFVSLASITSEVTEINLKNQSPQNTFLVNSHNFPVNNDLKKKISSNINENLDLFDDSNLLLCKENLSLNCKEPVKVIFTDLTTNNLTFDEEEKNNRCQTYLFQNFKLNLNDREKLPTQLKDYYLEKNADETTGILNSFETDNYQNSALHTSVSLSDMMNIGPAERKELVDNAKLVALFLKNSVQNFDSDINTLTNSIEFSSIASEIDTKTYIKDCSHVKSLADVSGKTSVSVLKKEEILTNEKRNYSSKVKSKNATAIPILNKNPKRKLSKILTSNTSVVNS